MNYNCKFCGRQTEQTYRFQYNSDIILEFYCGHCFTSFQYNSTTEEVCRWKIVSGRFHLVIDTETKRFWLSCYYPETDNYKLIFSTEFHLTPDITPSNMAKKLKTYILFS